MDAVVLADVEEPADGVVYYDDKHVNDAYNDARYGTHEYDAVPADDAVSVDEAPRADEAALADVVVPGRMHIFLITGINMRIFVFS